MSEINLEFGSELGGRTWALKSGSDLMSEMVEKVARAIAHAQLTRQYVGKLKNIGAVIEIDRIWPEFVPEASAAIEAVRAGLTPSMIEAGAARYLELRDAPVLRAYLVTEVIGAVFGKTDALLARLCDGDSEFDCHPLTPDEAAQAIVNGLLSDLSIERRDAIRRAINEWGSAWGSATASVAAQSTYR